LYPLEELAELYRERWLAEVHLRDLKTSLKMDILRCKTVDGVLKELYVFALVYNLARVVVGAASAHADRAVEFHRRSAMAEVGQAVGGAGQAGGQPVPA
jgi:IS4 transposase